MLMRGYYRRSAERKLVLQYDEWKEGGGGGGEGLCADITPERHVPIVRNVYVMLCSVAD